MPPQRWLLALAGAAGRSAAPPTGWRKERSELAVVAALAPVCADKFRALPDAEAKTVALSKAESWKRAEEFPQELVTLPGQTYPSSTLVNACYALLAPKSAALQ